MLMNENEYLKTVEQVKQEIRTAQYRATVQVNCELLSAVCIMPSARSSTRTRSGAANLLKTSPQISSCPSPR